MTKSLIALISAATLAFSMAALAQDNDEAASREEFRSIDQDVQSLKKEVSGSKQGSFPA